MYEFASSEQQDSTTTMSSSVTGPPRPHPIPGTTATAPDGPSRWSRRLRIHEEHLAAGLREAGLHEQPIALRIPRDIADGQAPSPPSSELNDVLDSIAPDSASRTRTSSV